MSSTDWSFEGRDLTLAWDNHVVSRDLTVRVPREQVTAIVGPNGCGKSTLLKSLARVLKPAEGTVLLEGEDIHSMPTKAVARRVALMAQTATAPPDITVRELVSRGRYPHQGLLQRLTPVDVAAIDSALAATSLTELQAVRVSELSGGQRQRVWLSMVLAQQTDILLLDEPTSYLDISHQYQLLELVRALRRQLGKTVVAVLHDLQQTARYADHVIVMKNGAIVTTGSPREVFDSELIAEVFGLEVDVMADVDSGELLIVPRPLPEPDVTMLN